MLKGLKGQTLFQPFKNKEKGWYPFSQSHNPIIKRKYGRKISIETKKIE